MNRRIRARAPLLAVAAVAVLLIASPVAVGAAPFAPGVSLLQGLLPGQPDEQSAQNRPPEAADDQASTPAGVAVTIDVLFNDTDPDGDALAVVGLVLPANGDAEVTAGGMVTYTPDAGFTGIDTFQYTVEDGNGGAGTATVTVTVGEDGGPARRADAPAPTATVQDATVQETCASRAGSHPSLDALCRIYASGQLPERAAAAVGTVIVRHHERVAGGDFEFEFKSKGGDRDESVKVKGKRDRIEVEFKGFGRGNGRDGSGKLTLDLPRPHDDRHDDDRDDDDRDDRRPSVRADRDHDDDDRRDDDDDDDDDDDGDDGDDDDEDDEDDD